MNRSSDEVAQFVLSWYIGNMVNIRATKVNWTVISHRPDGLSLPLGEAESEKRMKVERVQTGVRIEKHLLKVLKGLAEYLDMSLGDLLEGIVLHAFEGKSPFEANTLEKIEQLKAVYGMEFGSEASHQMIED